MLDRSAIGREYPPFTIEIEKGMLRLFAEAVGETNPIFLDEGLAREAGYRSLPAPPTYGFCLLQMNGRETFAHLMDLGVDLGRLLHAEQAFRYHRVLCAGDKVTCWLKIEDIYEKKGGALEIVVEEARLTTEDGALAVELRNVWIVRNG